MSWEVIALIAIVVAVLVSVPVLILMWKIAKRALDFIGEVHRDMDSPGMRSVDPFEALDAEVKKMTGQRSNPFLK